MIAIIGSRGFIGVNLVNFFKQNEIEFKEYSSKLGNLVDENLFLTESFELPDNCETIIYLSQSPNYKLFPEKYHELIKINTLLPFEIAKMAINKNVKKFIYFSTGSVYAPSLNPLSEDSLLNRESSYPLSKIHGEENLKILTSDIDVCCVRPFGVYGPGQKNMLVPNLISNIKDGKEIFVDRSGLDSEYDGLNISLSYIDDIVRSIYALTLASRLPFSLNLASSTSYSIKDIALEISNQLDIQVNIVNKEQLRKGNLVADCSQLQKLYCEQETSLEDGLKKFLDE